MNYTQFLLCKLAEEATEVAKAALKAQQFGLHDYHDDISNADRLIDEILDLRTIDLLLATTGVIRTPSSKEITEKTIKKTAKVAEFRRYSEKLGFVQKTNEQSKR